MIKKLLLAFLLIISFSIKDSFAQNFWEPVGKINGGRVVKVAVAPNGYMYAGGAYAGISRSTDNGMTWQQANHGLGNLQIKAIKCDPDNRVFVGTTDGIYRSADNGDNWQEVYPGVHCYDLSISSGGTIFAATYQDQVLRSQDNGDHWTRLQNGIDTTNIDLVNYTANGILIAVDYYKGIFKSPDKGESWTVSNNGYTVSDGPIAISSDKNGNIFIATTRGGLYESTDNGDSWSKINGDISDTYLLDVAEDSSGNLYAATFQDLFKSTNNGTNWTQLNTGTISRALQSVTVDSSNNIVVGTYDDGVVRSADEGASWETLNNGLHLTTIKNMVEDSSGNLYAVVSGKGIYESADDGKDWNLDNIKDDQYNLSILDLTALPTGGLLASATFGGTYMTTDNVHWHPFTHPFTGNYAFITVAASVNGYLFGGMSNGKIYRTPLSADNWTDITDTLSAKYIEKIGVSPEGEVFVLTDHGVFRSMDNGDTWLGVDGIPATYNFSIAFAPDGDIFIGGGGAGGGVYRSTDNGAKWTNSKDGLTNSYVWSLAIGNGKIYAGTNGGAFSSSDSGSTWHSLSGGLASGLIHSLVVSPSNHLIAGTVGSGIYTSTNVLTGIVKEQTNLPDQFMLHQNYPNPFNPTTEIKYSIVKTGIVRLTVYNVLGQEVQQLVNGLQSAGDHQIEFNANRFSSGVYIYRLEENGHVQTRKMILLK
ncbi:MAG TPA: YCF48-related protein [Balneolales bacterium]|nr:YCF48-related protein [Balneolales bacterium]